MTATRSRPGTSLELNTRPLSSVTPAASKNPESAAATSMSKPIVPCGGVNPSTLTVRVLVPSELSIR